MAGERSSLAPKIDPQSPPLTHPPCNPSKKTCPSLIFILARHSRCFFMISALSFGNPHSSASLHTPQRDTEDAPVFSSGDDPYGVFCFAEDLPAF